MISLQIINPRQLAPLLLALILGSAPVLAQPDVTGSAESPPAQAGGSTDKPAATQAPPAGSEPAAKSPGASSASPFDYRPSEEISEDVPVSFPVDI